MAAFQIWSCRGSSRGRSSTFRAKSTRSERLVGLIRSVNSIVPGAIELRVEAADVDAGGDQQGGMLFGHHDHSLLLFRRVVGHGAVQREIAGVVEVHEQRAVVGGWP